METKLKSFEIALEKGAEGEAIVRQILEERGWVVYQPLTEGAHAFDMMCIKDKKSAIALDIKAKARMNKWPATGVNQNHFEEYQRFSIKHKMPFYLIFVDEGIKKIYGNSIKELERPRSFNGCQYPMLVSQDKIRIWPLIAMKTISELSENHVHKLTQFNQRNYQYSPEDI